MALTYEAALDFLFPRTTTIKFGLATTRALLRSLGSPHKVVPALHIGGTNGKGSVCALVAAALREAGWRVGLYTSPHLVSFRERIQVDGVPISDAEFNPVAASGFEVARVAVPDGVHVFDGGTSPFSVIIVGYDQHDSYAYLGGTGTGKINPNPPG